MVKVIFQLGEKFYWVDHVEMFEVSSQTQIIQIHLATKYNEGTLL